jgi:glucosamine--fructose-6-phosphate aminotransferase (isomerizing)
MCGVIGYVGKGATPRFFFDGLKRLEYRGYDSAGIAMSTEREIRVVKAEGKLSALEQLLDTLPERSSTGIGHTRWATHGRPSVKNAHPHQSGPITLLHNGIIENHAELRVRLEGEGFTFLSETDTEVVVHLLNRWYTDLGDQMVPQERMKEALVRTIRELKGAYAFAILCQETPGILYAAKYGSPLALGRGEGENYLASGIAALVEHTHDVVMLLDGDVAVLSDQAITVYDRTGAPVERDFFEVNWSPEMLDKGGYPHFMLKEIHEHPIAIRETLAGRLSATERPVDLAKCGFEALDLESVDRIQLVACGTSYYAAQVGRYVIEQMTGIPVETDLASEYRYRASTVRPGTLTVAISQSGETIDTLFAVRHAMERGARGLGMVNAQGSSIALACHAECRLMAGPEVGVASTKAFSAQMAALFLLGLAVAQEKGTISGRLLAQYAEELLSAPAYVEQTLAVSSAVEAVASKIYQVPALSFIGRGPQWPVACEGALKVKELAYLFAEAYAGGEMKHGPIALIDEQLTTVVLAPRDSYVEKTISNVAEIRARGGKILAVGTEGDSELEALSDDFIGIPQVPKLIQPFITAIPMHLLGYWIAERRGHDIDQPRNLAKSVTVE